MEGIPPALKTDSEDVVWALQTAESLWKRSERVDAIVWLRRAAQAAGESDDAKRAAELAKHAASLSDTLSKEAAAKAAAAKAAAVKAAAAKEAAAKGKSKKPFPGMRQQSMKELDRMFGGGSIEERPIEVEPEELIVSSRDVVSAEDFEAGFGAPAAKPAAARGAVPAGPDPALKPDPTLKPDPALKDPALKEEDVPLSRPSDSEVMTVSIHAPDIELVEGEADEGESFPEDELTPALPPHASPAPARSASDSAVPNASDAHAGMLDPWAENERAHLAAGGAERGNRTGGGAKKAFEDEEVVTSAKARPAQPPPRSGAHGAAVVPPAPKAPRIPGAPGSGKKPPPLAPADGETDTTTYKQINPRTPRASRGPDRSDPSIEPPPRAPAPPPPLPSKRPVAGPPSLPAKPSAIPTPPRAAVVPSAGPPARPASTQPVDDLLDLVDSVLGDSDPPHASTAPTPRPPASVPALSTAPTPRPPLASVPASARPTAPPDGVIPAAAVPSSPPTKPVLGSTLLDLASVEALSDLPDDAREAFAMAAKTHALSKDEEVSHFALALIVDGAIDVSAQIVDAAAVRLERNAILRSRGTLTPGIPLRLVCASDKATIATWDDAAVASAFRTCPWVEEDLRAVADRVQSKAGVTMGPLGERFDVSLRDHLTSKLTVRSLSPGEVLVAISKPVPLAIVGVGDIVLTKKDGSQETLGPGEFLFPTQILAHGAAPSTAAAGPGGAIVLYGDRAIAQELLMSFPPLLEVLASI